MCGVGHSGWCVSVTWLELLMMLEIRVPLCSSVYECQSVECTFTSPVRMFVMCYMQYVMSASSVA